ncbi:hypothetical protein KSS87_003457 [Heliosperma pusillum]|nr:hypothetical protein KSS87_003457 [Heliosperma pusillum]
MAPSSNTNPSLHHHHRRNHHRCGEYAVAAVDADHAPKLEANAAVEGGNVNAAAGASKKPMTISLRPSLISSASAAAAESPVLRIETTSSAADEVYHSAEIFRLNYAEMESKFKVYIYPDGDSKTFYQTPRKLTGKYASEGYFFQNIRESSSIHFVDELNTFWMKCCVTCLDFRYSGTSYENMTIIVKDYVESLILKYPYWNRTLGADHFFVTCHDVGVRATEGLPFLVKNSIRVVCSPSYNVDFIPHKDVALPQVLQPFALPAGGNDLENRQVEVNSIWLSVLFHWVILARVWENDPELDISNNRISRAIGPLVYQKRFYRNKFCICPGGSQVNSARITDSIHYGCVPVIISDYYDLPFNDILDWRKFAVVLREQDVYQLKQILKRISDAEFARLHMNMVKVTFLAQISKIKSLYYSGLDAISSRKGRYKSTFNGIPLRSNMMHSIWLCMSSGCGITLSSTEVRPGFWRTELDRPKFESRGHVNEIKKTGQSAQERGLSHVPDCYEVPVSQRPTLDSPIANVPVIDVAGLRMGPAQRSTVINSIGKACRRFGFFQVVNHGIEQSILDKALAAADDFFELPANEKMKFMSSDVHKPVRYATSLRDGIDTIQYWRVFLKHYANPLEHLIQSWPEKPPTYRKDMGAYATGVQKLAMELTGAITESLGLSPKYLKQELEGGMQVIASNYYPPCPQPHLTLGLPPHSDYSCLTILLQSSPGLEIRDMEDGGS